MTQAQSTPSRLAIFALLLPVFLSAWLLGAHFLHHGSTLLMALCLFAPLPLLILQRPWLPRVYQALLLVAAALWLLALPEVMARVADAGRSTRPTLVIVSAVAAFTAASALVFQTRTLRRHFGT